MVTVGPDLSPGFPAELCQANLASQPVSPCCRSLAAGLQLAQPPLHPSPAFGRLASGRQQCFSINQGTNGVLERPIRCCRAVLGMVDVHSIPGLYPLVACTLA